jgi:hypothetical protein
MSSGSRPEVVEEVEYEGLPVGTGLAVNMAAGALVSHVSSCLARYSPTARDHLRLNTHALFVRL